MTAATHRIPHPKKHRELNAVDTLVQLSFLVQGILQRRAAEYDLSITQTRLLGILRDRTPTMNDLAKHLVLDKSSITGLIDRAERRGIVVRVPSTADRRSVRVRLTDEGRSLVSRVLAQFDSDISTLLASLSPPERATLSSLVSRVLVADATEHGVDLFATSDKQN